MITRLNVLEKIDQYLENKNAELQKEVAKGYSKSLALSRALGPIIKVLHCCLTDSFFNIGAKETVESEFQLNRDFATCSTKYAELSGSYEALKLYHMQVTLNKTQQSLAEKDSKEEKSVNDCLQNIYKNIISILSLIIDDNHVKELDAGTLRRITQVLPEEQLALLANTNLLSIMLKKGLHVANKRRQEFTDFVENVAPTITTIKQFNDITKHYDQDLSGLPVLMKKGSQLLKTINDLNELRVNLDFIHYLKLSSAFIKTACESITTFDELESVWKTQPQAFSSMLLLAKEPLFSYRVFIELNLTREQFFKLWAIDIHHVYPCYNFSRIMMELMINTPIVLAKMNSFIQSVQDFNKLKVGSGHLILAKIITNKKEAVALFNRVFANNLKELFQLPLQVNTRENRKPLMLTTFISYDENRQILSKNITAIQLAYLLKCSAKNNFNTENKYLALSTEDEILSIVTRIYPDFATFYQHMKTTSFISTNIIEFLFKYEKPRQYIAGLFNTADQLLKFFQRDTEFSPHPAHTIATIIFTKQLTPDFLASVTNEKIFFAFPEHRITLITEKIAEAVPGGIKDLNHIIASYLFFAPPRITPQLELIQPIETNQLALDRKI